MLGDLNWKNSVVNVIAAAAGIQVKKRVDIDGFRADLHVLGGETSELGVSGRWAVGLRVHPQLPDPDYAGVGKLG